MTERFDPAVIAVTKHERALLSYLALGMGRLDIEKHTGIPEGTVKTQIRTLYRKLRVNNAPHAVGVGFTYKLINPQAMQKAYELQYNGPTAINV
jgi:DNA-binding NarL/FixJ family response regulator